MTARRTRSRVSPAPAGTMGLRGGARAASTTAAASRWSTSTPRATGQRWCASLRRHACSPSPATSAIPARCARRTRRSCSALGAVDVLVNNAGILSNNKVEATDARRVAPRARRQPRRRVLLVAGGACPAMKARALGPHRQHRLARRQDRRPHRRHRLRGVQGRARRAHLLARARARRRTASPPTRSRPAYVQTPMVTEQLNEAQRQALLRADSGRPLLRARGVRARVRFLASPLVGLHHRRDPRPQRRPADGLTAMSDAAPDRPTTRASSPAARPARPRRLRARRLRRHRRGDRLGPGAAPARASRSPAASAAKAEALAARAAARPATTRSASRWTRTRPTSIRAAVDAVAPRFGGLDLLVNCIGIQREERLAEVSEAAFDEIVAGQPQGRRCSSPRRPRATRSPAPRPRAGRQVHLLSVRAQLGMRDRGYSAYCATKGALVMLIKQHAVELSPHGITVNGVAPTVVRGEMGAHWLANPATRGAHRSRASRSAASPSREDVVGAALFFCSPACGVRHRPDPLRRRRHHRHPVSRRVVRTTFANP